MSALKLNGVVIISQDTIQNFRDSGSKLVTIASSFYDSLPVEVKPLVDSLSPKQITFMPDGACYLTRYLTKEERKELTEHFNTDEEERKAFGPEFIADSCITSFKNIHVAGCVPLIRVAAEGFEYLTTVLNTFFNQLDHVSHSGNLNEFDLLDIIKKPGREVNLRDSIFSTICHLCKIYVSIINTVLINYDTTTNVISTTTDWSDIPFADGTPLSPLYRTAKFISKKTETQRKLIFSFPNVRSVCVRSLALISIMSGRTWIENDLDSLIYIYAIKANELFDRYATVPDDKFCERVGEYREFIPSFSGLYRVKVKAFPVSIKLFGKRSVEYGNLTRINEKSKKPEVEEKKNVKVEPSGVNNMKSES